MLKHTYCYLLFFFFLGLTFVSNVFDFASLYDFTASLKRPGNFECIIRFVDLFIVFKVKKSFQVCDINSSDPDKVRNGAFFKQCMGKALHNLEDYDANKIDDDPFELYD